MDYSFNINSNQYRLNIMNKTIEIVDSTIKEKKVLKPIKFKHYMASAKGKIGAIVKILLVLGVRRSYSHSLTLF